jgi:organic hydroperoxide reductase OsmC/OhrA
LKTDIQGRCRERFSRQVLGSSGERVVKSGARNLLPCQEMNVSQYSAQIDWHRQPQEAFVDSRYSRAHRWSFDGGVTVPASSAVSSVPLPYSKPENVDPEEALVAAISSCHMLMFLYLAAKAGFVVDSYEDLAVGTMGENSRGRKSIVTTVLAPKIEFSGARKPTDEIVQRLHHEAHEECYIANSVRTEISVAGSWSFRG